METFKEIISPSLKLETQKIKNINFTFVGEFIRLIKINKECILAFQSILKQKYLIKTFRGFIIILRRRQKDYGSVKSILSFLL
jgi:hypothetical protein